MPLREVDVVGVLDEGEGVGADETGFGQGFLGGGAEEDGTGAGSGGQAGAAVEDDVVVVTGVGRVDSEGGDVDR